MGTLDRARPDASRDDPIARLRQWDSLVERRIREAMDAGAFDQLPHRGRPLPLGDDGAAGEKASAFGILRNAGTAPRWIEADRDARRLLGERDGLLIRAQRSSVLSRQRYRDELRALVESHNRAVLVLNHEAPTIAQHRSPLDLERELGALERLWTQ